MMRTANPALNSKTFDQFGVAFSRESSNVMTLQGTVNQTGFLLLILVAAGTITWRMTTQNPGTVYPWMIFGLIFGLVTLVWLYLEILRLLAKLRNR